MTLADVALLAPTLNDAGAAEIWGVSPDLVGEQARNNCAPVEPIYLGRCRRWPTIAVLRSVGIEWTPQGGP